LNENSRVDETGVHVSRCKNIFAETNLHSEE